jgi:hypothetical protein
MIELTFDATRLAVLFFIRFRAPTALTLAIFVATLRTRRAIDPGHAFLKPTRQALQQESIALQQTVFGFGIHSIFIPYNFPRNLGSTILNQIDVGIPSFHGLDRRLETTLKLEVFFRQDSRHRL